MIREEQYIAHVSLPLESVDDYASNRSRLHQAMLLVGRMAL